MTPVFIKGVLLIDGSVIFVKNPKWAEALGALMEGSVKLWMILLVAVAFAVAREACACAAVARPGEAVSIAAEEAFIVWDAKAKVQHFIRRAAFNGNAKDIGFLVPTPTKPELGESSDYVFANTLPVLTRPPIEVKKRSADAVAASARDRSEVRVLGTATVAGFDAAILETSSAGSLDQWLRRHGYASSPELMAWYARYVAQGWKITAFKISAGGAARVSTAAVRMSFRAEEPFFPYREPKGSGGDSSRLLRIYFAAAQKPVMPGGLRRAETFSLAADDGERLEKYAQLPAGSLSAARWLAVLEDTSSVRRDEDLYFLRRAKR